MFGMFREEPGGQSGWIRERDGMVGNEILQITEGFHAE